jgi:hypothetical protein
MDRSSAQIHDKKKNRRNGRRDEQASRDAGSNDSFRGRVWRDVSVCARGAIGGGGNYSKHRHRRATVLVEFNVGDLIEGKTEGRKQSWQRG